MKIIFAGTPDFAALHLQALLDSSHQVVAVYTQPDRPAGRGKKTRPGPVKQLALQHQLPVYQPLSLRNDEAQAELAALQADIMVVVAYGLILPQAVLDTPRLGCINVHASLLPRWRGAAPIQRAIAAGDNETGITIMQMDAGLDTGAMLHKVRCNISADDSAASLHDKLAVLGGPALLHCLQQLAEGSAVATAQDDSASCYAEKINKQEAALDWRLSAEVLARQVRAFNPFPASWAEYQGQRIKCWQAQPLTDQSSDSAAGTIVAVSRQGIVVRCGEGCLALQQLQLPGKRAMTAEQLINGHPELFVSGQRFSNAHVE